MPHEVVYLISAISPEHLRSLFFIRIIADQRERKMGCIPSKDFASVNPSLDRYSGNKITHSGSPYDAAPNSSSSASFQLKKFNKNLEGELVAAGWPSWLSSVAGDAIQGLVPLKSDSFETMEKVIQKIQNPH